MNQELNERLTQRLDALLPGSWCVSLRYWHHRHEDGTTQVLEEEWSIWCAKDERRWSAATLQQAVNMLENDAREEAMR